MSTTFNARIEHASHTTSRATVRSHTVLVDRPVAKGGRDLGPAGGEYLLVALGGCFTSHLLAASHARDAAISDVRVHVTGTLDGTPERFSAFALDVSATCNDAELARKLIAIAGRACQVVSTLRQVATIAITYEGSTIEPGEPATV